MAAFQLPCCPSVTVQAACAATWSRAGCRRPRPTSTPRGWPTRRTLGGRLGVVPRHPRLAHGTTWPDQGADDLRLGAQGLRLGRAAAQATARFVTAAYLFVELEAGHWLPEKHPDEVAALVIDRVRALAARVAPLDPVHLVRRGLSERLDDDQVDVDVRRPGPTQATQSAMSSATSGWATPR